MKILSLFDGIACARVALERAGIPVEVYYASEIDKYAIQISKKNYPDIRQLGDVKDIQTFDKNPHQIMIPVDDGYLGRMKGIYIGQIDILVGGSHCQDLSIAKKDRKGLNGERSSLFWEYVRILKEVKPKYFILENVNSMPKEAKKIITRELGVEPIMINASLVSAQNRKRLFWTNIPNVTLPKDRGILLKDILLPNTYTEFDKSFALTKSYNGAVLWNSIEKSQRTMVWNKPIKVGHFNKGGQGQRVYSIDGKSVTLSAKGGGWGAKTGLYQIKDYARKLEPIECERLTGLPDNYTEGISKNKRREVCGNAFNVDVVAWILKHIK